MSDIPDDAPVPDETPPAPDSPPPPTGVDIPAEARDPSGRSADSQPRTAETPSDSEPYPRSDAA